MSAVSIDPVTTKRQQKQFLALPWKLYKNDPVWVPPLRQNQKEMVGYKHHAFYDDAEAQTFIAYKDGEPVGRISSILNHAHNRRHNEERGFFGFFETIDDTEVAHGLFDAARAWLAERDVHLVRGPLNPSMNYEIGLLVEGFERSPTFMMTYNPPYYQKLIEDYGFVKAQDAYSFILDRSMHPESEDDAMLQKLKFVGEEAKKRFGVSFRQFDRKNFKQDVLTFLEIYNESLGGTWGYVPLSQGEIDHMSKSLKTLIEPDITSVAMVEGRVVGATFGMLDFNPRIREIDGRLFPFGWIKLLTGRKNITRIRMLSTNVRPEYQRWGVGLLVMLDLYDRMIDSWLEEIEFSWVLESNDLSRKTIERAGSKRVCTFRIYDYGEPAPAE